MRARGLMLAGLVLLCALTGGIVFGSASALAAAPEAPELTVVSPVPAATATLIGVLNPKATAPGEAGTYEFLYKKSKTECVGESKAPVPPGMALGLEHEEVVEGFSGLAPGTEYTVCLREETVGGEAVSSPVTFTTAIPPEVPVTISPAKSITATSAVFEGTLNPKAEATTGYFFFYGSTGVCSEGLATEPVVAVKLKASSSVSTLATGLEPGRKYGFCVVATNIAGEIAVGNEVSFTTPAAPPAVEAESATGVKASEARLEGVVNPNNQATECKFQYGTESSLATSTSVLCEPASFAGIFGGQGVGLTVRGLEAKTTYYYRIIAINGTGTTEGTIEHFKTALPPETPETRAASEVTVGAATLHGVLNPASSRESEPGSYQFYYRQSTTECRGENEIPTGVTPALGVEKEAVQASIAGLLPHTVYTFCLDAVNEAGEETLGAPETLTTLAASPTVAGEESSSVIATEAKLSAQVDAGGTPTTYHVEYGTSEAYGSSTPETNAGAGSVAASVEAQLSKLEPGTLYHYRFVAHNSVGSAEGTDLTFTTTLSTGATALTLPDNRAYELVSSPEETEVYLPRNGEPLSEEGTGEFTGWYGYRAAAGGDAVAYMG